MTDPRSPYRTGALFVALSAALHLIAPVISLGARDGLMLLPFGIVLRNLFRNRTMIQSVFICVLFCWSVLHSEKSSPTTKRTY